MERISGRYILIGREPGTYKNEVFEGCITLSVEGWWRVGEFVEGW